MFWDSSAEMINGQTIWPSRNGKEKYNWLESIFSFVICVSTLDPLDIWRKKMYTTDISRLKFQGHFLYWLPALGSSLIGCFHGMNLSPLFYIINTIYNQILLKRLYFASDFSCLLSRLSILLLLLFRYRLTCVWSRKEDILKTFNQVLV